MKEVIPWKRRESDVTSRMEWVVCTKWSGCQALQRANKCSLSVLQTWLRIHPAVVNSGVSIRRIVETHRKDWQPAWKRQRIYCIYRPSASRLTILALPCFLIWTTMMAIALSSSEELNSERRVRNNGERKREREWERIYIAYLPSLSAVVVFLLF